MTVLAVSGEAGKLVQGQTSTSLAGTCTGLGVLTLRSSDEQSFTPGDPDSIYVVSMLSLLIVLT